MLNTNGFTYSRLFTRLFAYAGLTASLLTATAVGQAPAPSLIGSDIDAAKVKSMFNFKKTKHTDVQGTCNAVSFDAYILKGCAEQIKLEVVDTETPIEDHVQYIRRYVRLSWAKEPSAACLAHSTSSCDYRNIANCESLSINFPALNDYRNGCPTADQVELHIVSRKDGQDSDAAVSEQNKVLAASFTTDRGKKIKEISCSDGKCFKDKKISELVSAAGSDPVVREVLVRAYLDSDIKARIDGAKDIIELKAIEAEIAEIAKANPSEDPDLLAQIGLLGTQIASKKETLKGTEFTALKSRISKAKDLAELEALTKDVTALVGNIDLDDRKAPREQRELGRAYRSKYESLLEKSVKTAKREDFEEAMAKALEYAEKHDSFVGKLEGILESRIQALAKSTKDKDDLEELTNIAQNVHATLSGSDEYEGDHYRDSIAFIAGRRMALAKGKDAEILEEYEEIKELLEDTKSDLDDESVASLDSLIVDMDLKRARVELLPALQGVMAQAPFMGPGQAQWMMRDAISQTFKPLVDSARDNYNDACYGYNDTQGSVLGGFISWNFASQFTPSPTVENRVACGNARASYSRVNGEVANSFRMGNAFLQKSMQDAQQMQQSGGLGGINGSFDPMSLGLTPSLI